MELTDAQLQTVVTVYLASLLPAVILLLLALLKKIPTWIITLYLSTFVICALGWEIWLTYGLVDGLDVDSRRPTVLATAIPMHINWILNSLGDAAIGLVGTALVWLCYGGNSRAFSRWHWPAFCILLLWFVGQNLWVELYIYQSQLAEGFRLSWAPLIPTGPWFNPTVLELDGRTVQLQTQWPWLIMTPIYYRLIIWFYPSQLAH